MIVAKSVVGLALLYASFQDLKTLTVHDKVFLTGGLVALASGLWSQSIGFAGAMVVQSVLGVLSMFLLQFFYGFGTADVWAVGLSVMVFPEILLFSLFVPLFICTLVWTKIYGLVMRRSSAPALPGVFIGFLLLLSIYGI